MTPSNNRRQDHRHQDHRRQGLILAKAKYGGEYFTFLGEKLASRHNPHVEGRRLLAKLEEKIAASHPTILRPVLFVGFFPVYHIAGYIKHYWAGDRNKAAANPLAATASNNHTSSSNISIVRTSSSNISNNHTASSSISNNHTASSSISSNHTASSSISSNHTASSNIFTDHISSDVSSGTFPGETTSHLASRDGNANSNRILPRMAILESRPLKASDITKALVAAGITSSFWQEIVHGALITTPRELEAFFRAVKTAPSVPLATSQGNSSIKPSPVPSFHTNLALAIENKDSNGEEPLTSGEPALTHTKTPSTSSAHTKTLSTSSEKQPTGHKSSYPLEAPNQLSQLSQLLILESPYAKSTDSALALRIFRQFKDHTVKTHTTESYFSPIWTLNTLTHLQEPKNTIYFIDSLSLSENVEIRNSERNDSGRESSEIKNSGRESSEIKNSGRKSAEIKNSDKNSDIKYFVPKHLEPATAIAVLSGLGTEHYLEPLQQHQALFPVYSVAGMAPFLTAHQIPICALMSTDPGYYNRLHIAWSAEKYNPPLPPMIVPLTVSPIVSRSHERGSQHRHARHKLTKNKIVEDKLNQDKPVQDKLTQGDTFAQDKLVQHKMAQNKLTQKLAQDKFPQVFYYIDNPHFLTSCQTVFSDPDQVFIPMDASIALSLIRWLAALGYKRIITYGIDFQVTPFKAHVRSYALEEHCFAQHNRFTPYETLTKDFFHNLTRNHTHNLTRNHTHIAASSEHRFQTSSSPFHSPQSKRSSSHSLKSHVAQPHSSKSHAFPPYFYNQAKLMLYEKAYQTLKTHLSETHNIAIIRGENFTETPTDTPHTRNSNLSPSLPRRNSLKITPRPYARTQLQTCMKKYLQEAKIYENLFKLSDDLSANTSEQPRKTWLHKRFLRLQENLP